MCLSFLSPTFDTLWELHDKGFSCILNPILFILFTKISSFYTWTSHLGSVIVKNTLILVLKELQLTSIVHHHVWNLFFVQSVLHQLFPLLPLKHIERQLSTIVRSGFSFKGKDELVRILRACNPSLKRNKRVRNFWSEWISLLLLYVPQFR